MIRVGRRKLTLADKRKELKGVRQGVQWFLSICSRVSLTSYSLWLRPKKTSDVPGWLKLRRTIHWSVLVGLEGLHSIRSGASTFIFSYESVFVTITGIAMV